MRTLTGKLRRAVATLVVAAATVVVLGPATRAAPITYDYNATCTLICSSIGLTNGTPVSGSITFDDTNFAPFATITRADVMFFSFTFGTVSISDTTAAGFNFLGDLSSNVMAFATFDFEASEVLGGPPSADTVGLGHTSGAATRTGNCSDMNCSVTNFLASAGFQGTGTLTTLSTPSTRAPEPMTLALLGLGLAGLGLARRRMARAAFREA